MSYAAMLSPFSMPYPKQGGIYKVYIASHDILNMGSDDYAQSHDPIPDGYTYREDPHSPFTTAITKGDLLCVTHKEYDKICVWPCRQRIIGTAKMVVRTMESGWGFYNGEILGEDPIFHYKYKKELPCMGIALTSGEFNSAGIYGGTILAKLISTNPLRIDQDKYTLKNWVEYDFEAKPAGEDVINPWGDWGDDNPIIPEW